MGTIKGYLLNDQQYPTYTCIKVIVWMIVEPVKSCYQ